MSECNPLHGTDDEYGQNRWCRVCQEWIYLPDWGEHEGHAPAWQCEACGEHYTEATKPDRVETYPGHRETVKLWFCAGCSE